MADEEGNGGDPEENSTPTNVQSIMGLDPKVQLLSTIRLPNNLKLLSDRLPKSKYDEDIVAAVDSKDGSSSLIISASDLHNNSSLPNAKHILI